MPILLEEVEMLVPGFTIGDLHDVRSVNLEFQTTESPSRQRLRLCFVVEFAKNGSKYSSILKLEDVRQLILPELGTNWFAFEELEFRDIRDRGMEGLSYEFKDYGASGLSCYCGDFYFDEFVKLSDGRRIPIGLQVPDTIDKPLAVPQYKGPAPRSIRLRKLTSGRQSGPEDPQ